MKVCYSVQERGRGKKPLWVPIGAAWENADGSWSLVINSLPLTCFKDGNLRLQVREKPVAEGETLVGSDTTEGN